MSMSLLINDLKRHTDPLRDELDAAVRRVLDRGWFVLGPEVAAFESQFAAWCGTPHCVSVGNGTDALELALRAVGVEAGDPVVTVANAGLYGTVAILAMGAEPVYVDVCPDTLLIDPLGVAGALKSGPVKAILVTHLYGRLADMEAILPLAQSAGIPVVEDCAQAHGAQRGGHRAGSFGDAGCFSFYPTKNLGALGDGGAVVTRRADVEKRLMRLRQYGWSSKYHAAERGGRNSRLDELQAAVLAAKLPHVDAWNERRRGIAVTYNAMLGGAGLICPPGAGVSDFVAHLYVVQVDANERESLRNRLGTRGIATDVHYPVPDHKQKAVAERFAHVRLPVTEAACERVLTLPCFPEMTDAEVAQVIQAVNGR